MKHILKGIAIMSVGLLFSCSNNATNDKGTTNSEQKDSTRESGMGHSETAYTPGSKLDPVCGMEKGDDWTDFAIHKGDTVWFCSEGCKKAFEARPEKYTNSTKG